MQSRISLATQISCCLIFTRFCAGLNRKSLLSTRQFKNSLPVSASNIFLLKAHDMNKWDAENGVWLGDMATSDDVLPSPLYMFGYGSLLWRPGDLLCDFPSYSCVCSGWQRIFAQRSSDHRGSPEFPGFVATLVEASYLDSVNRDLTSKKTSEEVKCSGLIWTIPDDRVEATIAELDYRERGGYHRHVITVTLNENTAYHSAGTVVNALVYSGSISNPNFHFILDGVELRNIQTAKNGIAEVEESHMTSTPTPTAIETLSPRSATADIIAAAVGPSGPNSEYLFNLNDFILLNGLEDGYIQTLARNVALRMGPWRSPVSRRYQVVKEPGDSTERPGQVEEKVSNTVVNFPSNASGELRECYSERERERDGGLLEAFLRSNMILGWGSNEYQQLGARTIMTHPDCTLQATCGPIRLEVELAPRGTCTVPTSNLQTKHSQSDSRACASASMVDDGTQNGDSTMKPLARQIDVSQILCGVGYSAFLDPTGVLSLWGESAAEYVSQSPIPVSIEERTERGADTAGKSVSPVIGGVVVSAVATGSSPVIDIVKTGQGSAGPVKEVTKVSDVAGAALGYEHMLLLSESGWVAALGDNYWGQCLGPKSFVRVGSKGLKSRLSKHGDSSSDCCYSANISPGADSHSDCRDPGPAVKILKVAAGVRHSAAVTVDGSLYVWGAGSAGRIAPLILEGSLSAQSEGTQRDIMISQVVVVEKKVGAMVEANLGSMTALRVSPGASSAAIQEPTSAGSGAADGPGVMASEMKSSSARGAAVDVAVGQSESETSECSEAWCPPDAKLIDVSCGLHHTVAVDERGRVWSFGDDKFGSLGRPLPLPAPLHNVAVGGSDDLPRGSADSLNNASPPASASASAPSESARNGNGNGSGRVQTKDSTPRLVEGLEEGVRWQRACCGWSHTVVRGVRPDGSIACAAWGRRNLGQYPLEDSRGDSSGSVTLSNGSAAAGRLVEDSQQGSCGVSGAERESSSLTASTQQCAPQRLSLPHGLCIREVWAGTEFTVVADEKGDLWACGWNEHGNLGRGGSLAFESSHEWVKVFSSKHRDEGMMQQEIEEVEVEARAVDCLRGEKTSPGSPVTHGQQVRLSTVWEGALACGGGHVLCLTDASAGRDL